MSEGRRKPARRRIEGKAELDELLADLANRSDALRAGAKSPFENRRFLLIAGASRGRYRISAPVEMRHPAFAGGGQQLFCYRAPGNRTKGVEVTRANL